MLLLAAALLLAACQPAEDRAWQRVSESGVLRVGLDAAYPPFESLNVEGEPVGFDVDLAREIGRRLGLEIVFINIPYDGLFDSLAAGQTDLLISALVVTYEARSKAAFSTPYFNVGERLVVRGGSPISQMADLEGLTVAVELGSDGDVEARRWQRRLAALTITHHVEPDRALQDVLAGEADAALVDGITAQLAVSQHPGLSLSEPVNDRLLAAAAHPDSRRLLSQVNRALREMHEDGTIVALIERWFGAVP